MNGKLTDSDKMTTDYLDGKSELSETYAESKSTTVPDRLSDNIKALARQELTDKKRTLSWFIPASLAATVVLSISLYYVNLPQSPIKSAPQLVEKTSSDATEDKKQVVQVQPADKSKVITAINNQPIPAHIQDLLQTTAKRTVPDSDSYPTAKELKTWTPQQWAKKIYQLQEANKPTLENKYIQDFHKYFPQHDVYELIKALNR